jgi:GNAT superfamily N-acetyltransferase
MADESMLEIRVRPAAAGDAAEMAKLAGQLGYPMSGDEMLRRLERLLPDGAHCIMVVANTRQLLGFMHAERRFSLEGGERAELMGLVIDATARRHGAGRRLVETAERWALSQGELSHPFYRALGYELDKTQHVYTKSLT